MTLHQLHSIAHEKSYERNQGKIVVGAHRRNVNHSCWHCFQTELVQQCARFITREHRMTHENYENAKLVKTKSKICCCYLTAIRERYDRSIRKFEKWHATLRWFRFVWECAQCHSPPPSIRPSWIYVFGFLSKLKSIKLGLLTGDQTHGALAVDVCHLIWHKHKKALKLQMKSKLNTLHSIANWISFVVCLTTSLR